MKKKILLVVLFAILVIIVVRVVTSNKNSPIQTTHDLATDSNKNGTELSMGSKSVNFVESNPNQNIETDVGRSYYDKPTQPAPTPDVSANFILNRGDSGLKVIEAKSEQRISLKFAGSFMDEVVIEGYDLSTYIDFLFN